MLPSVERRRPAGPSRPRRTLSAQIGLVDHRPGAYARTDERVTTLITDLVRRGDLRLGVISNVFREDVLPWSGCALAPAFQCAVFSCEEGLAKPDPEIYLRAVHRLGGTPATTIYIGDGADNELAGAEQAWPSGVPCCLVRAGCAAAGGVAGIAEL